MMFTINKIFIDSSVLVEAFKGNKINFYNQLVSNIDNDLKEKGSIPAILTSILQENLLPKDFSLLPSDPSFFDLVPDLMIKYNLLPNDAIILATCKIYSITKLASHDSDFIIPCKAEGIELLRED